MQIFNGEGDRPFVPSNRTVSIISWGFSFRKYDDGMTIRKNGRRDWSFFYCEQGRMSFAEAEITAGQAFIYPPDVPQRYVIYAADRTKYYYLHFTGSDIGALFESVGIGSGVLTPGESLSELMTAIGAAYREGDAVAGLKSEYLVLKLFHTLAASGSARLKHPVIRRVLAEMAQDYASAYDVKKYAAIACLSVSRFNHLFCQQQGVAPMTYFINLKVEHAAHLLEMTDLSVSEIAGSVGYADSFGFSKIFKGRTGLSPTAYRKCYKHE